MARPADAHLRLEEIDLFLPSLFFEPEQDEKSLQAKAHLDSCEICQERVRVHQEVQAHLDGLKARAGLRGPDCPGQEEWEPVAAGLAPDREAKERLRHASQCAYCGSLLRQAAEVFSDEVTLAEQELLAGLRSNRADWQRQLAVRLSASSERRVDPQVERRGSNIVGMFPYWRWASASVLALTLAGGWFLWHPHAPNRFDQVSLMLGEAYTKNRIMDLRIDNAAYGPVADFRGSGETNSAFDRPSTLLRAEDVIGQELRKNPNDVAWLHLKGRADLIEGHSDAAIDTLETVLKIRPEDASARFDLAVAYSQRADAKRSHDATKGQSDDTNSRTIDYGKAIDLLGPVLARQQDNAAALFDRAILFERLALYHQAEKDWQHYLRIDSNSLWASEARSHLANVQEIIGKSHNRSSTPLDSPFRFAERVKRGDAVEMSGIDRRIEKYLDLAVKSWLPQAFPISGLQNDQSVSARAGLEALAVVLKTRHHDYWLSDFIASADTYSDISEPVAWVSESYKASLAGDDDSARSAAARAVQRFKGTRNKAGRLYGEWEVLYATRLSLSGRECFAVAGRLWSQVQKTSYHWLGARVLLDNALCAYFNTQIEAATRSDDLSQRLSRRYLFPDLNLRAVKDSAETYGETRGSAALFSSVVKGLKQFWGSDVSYMAGYNLYSALDADAEFHQLWYLDAAVIREALQLSEEDPDIGMRAAEEQRLANALLLSGDIAGAADNLVRVHVLIDSMPPSKSKLNKLADVEINTAISDIDHGNPVQAVFRLEQVQDQVQGAANRYLSFEFFAAYGRALSASGREEEAKKALYRAIEISQIAIDGLHEGRDRLLWSHRTSPVYREVVRLELRNNPIAAFGLWERFKSLSLRNNVQHVAAAKYLEQETLDALSGARGGRIPQDTAVVSYAVFPDGLATWIYDNAGVHDNWTEVSRQTLELASQSFAAHCADPTYPLASIHDEGANLYKLLWRPLEELLRTHKKVIVEPDDILDGIPFEALVDSSGHYLVDSFTLSFSPGLFYLTLSSRPILFSAQTRTLVVADSDGHPDLGLINLPDVGIEAHAVASSFRNSKLFLNADATVSRVARELPKAELFHFAGHAFINADTAGLVLGESGNQGSEFFRAIQFSPVSLRKTRLVVLSACATADGPNGVLSDSESLARTLVAKGVPQVVASRWRVNSSVTADLMEHFYASVLQSKSISEALREAEKRLRDNAKEEHPFYWAGFAVFGTA